MIRLFDWFFDSWQFWVLLNFVFGATFSIKLKLNLVSDQMKQIEHELRQKRKRERQQVDERIG